MSSPSSPEIKSLPLPPLILSFIPVPCIDTWTRGFANSFNLDVLVLSISLSVLTSSSLLSLLDNTSLSITDCAVISDMWIISNVNKINNKIKRDINLILFFAMIF
jgi:hypothetical protein